MNIYFKSAMKRLVMLGVRLLPVATPVICRKKILDQSGKNYSQRLSLQGP